MRGLQLRATLVILGLFGAWPAAATQITIGPSNEFVTFVWAAAGVVDVKFGTCLPGGCTLTGPALFQNLGVGFYAIMEQPIALVPFGPAGGVDDYPLAPNNTSSTVKFTNGVALPVNYAFLYGASPNVQFTGSDGPSPGDYFDFSLHQLTCVGLAAGQPCTIQTIANLEPVLGKLVPEAFATISSGEFVYTPEPGGLLLAGLGFGAFAFRWWRRSRSFVN
jgi:hypothetical protein